MNDRRLITCVALACLGASSAWAQVAPIADSNGNEIKIFPLRYAQCTEASKIIAQIYESRGPLVEANALRVGVDERTNSVIAIGDRETLETVEAILLRLDEKPSSQPEPNAKRLVSFQLKNMRASEAAAAVDVLGLDLDDARIVEDADSNRLVVFATQEAMSRVEELIRTMDVSRPSPPPESFTIRVVWLVERSLVKEDTPPVPDDLQAAISKLAEKFGLDEFRMVAQMTVNATEPGTYSATCNAAAIGNFKFSGTLDEQASRLQVQVSTFIPGKETSPMCEISTAIKPELGRPFILGTTPIGSFASVFVVELVDVESEDEAE